VDYFFLGRIRALFVHAYLVPIFQNVICSCSFGHNECYFDFEWLCMRVLEAAASLLVPRLAKNELNYRDTQQLWTG